jgi:hypothetical protein
MVRRGNLSEGDLAIIQPIENVQPSEIAMQVSEFYNTTWDSEFAKDSESGSLDRFANSAILSHSKSLANLNRADQATLKGRAG